NYREVGKLAGNLAAEVLNGRDPATVPIDNVVPEILTINQLALSGLKDTWMIPPALHDQADLVIDATGKHHKAGATAEIPRPPPGKKFKIGIAYFGPDPGAESDMQGLFDGLKTLGFEEGKNLEVRKMHAQGEISNIPGVLQTLDNSDVDVIIPMSTPCITAACGMVKQKPVVFTYCYDPIAAGAGESFTNHLPFVTGIGSFPPVADTVELIKQLVPGVHAVGTLYNTSEANSRKVIEVARGLFAQHGIKLEETAIVNSSEVYQAAQALVGRDIQAIWITGDNTALQGFDGIVKNARAAKLPLIINDPEFTARGALACVGLGFYQSGFATAKPLARVLMGENPRDIPIENVSTKTLVLNREVAQTLGVTFPPALIQAEQAQNAARKVSTPLAKKWQIAEVTYSDTPNVEDALHGVAAGFKEAGLVEGRDYELKLRNAQGDMATLNTIMNAAVTDGSDLILTATSPALQAALKQAQNTPVVFTLVANPFIAGAGKADADHLPNVTGCYFVSPFDEMMVALKQCIPGLKTIGTLYAPAEINSVFFKEKWTEAAKKAGLEVEVVGASSSGEVPDAALALCNRNIGAFCQISDSLSSATFASIVQVAKRAKIPLFAFSSQQAQSGAVVCVARDYFDNGRSSAALAARIMRGENPATIPFGQEQSLKVFVNLQAAAANNLTIPEAIVKKADAVIGLDGKFIQPVAAQPKPIVKATKPTAPAPLAKKWKIRFVEYVQVTDVEDTERGIFAGLEQAGLVRDRDYEVKISNAQNDMPTLSALVDSAVSEGADLIVPISTPALQAAIRRAGSVPIVFTYCANSAMAGASKTLTDHLPNLTGVESPGAYKDLIAMVQECLPNAKSVGTIFAPSEVNTVFHKEQIIKAATAAGIKVEAVPAETGPEVSDAALAVSNRKIDAICQIGGNLTASSFPSIARAAYSAKLPLFASLSSQAEAGAAVVVARDYYDSGVDTGLMMARVMRGEKTADIPIEVFTKTKIIVNLNGAKACGMTIPASVLKRASAVIGGPK
ncbi:MAG TPA: ABC transporter substrate binding protein, partial [Verrucomicrobiae bacterium]